MNRILFALFSVTLLASTGCAVDGTDSGDDERDPNIGVSQEALTSGASDPSGTTGTVAEKPKFDVESCITTRMLLEGWSRSHAKAYCECRAKGYSDFRCVNTIPFIDL